MNTTLRSVRIGLISVAFAFPQLTFADASPRLTDIGTLGGSLSVPTAVNAVGQVVGYAGTAGDAGNLAFVWDATRGIQALTLGGDYSESWDINDAGQVAGNSYTVGNANYHAFVWDAVNGICDLGTLGGSDSWTLGQNAAGHVIGYSLTAGNALYQAFFWDGTHGMQALAFYLFAPEYFGVFSDNEFTVRAYDDGVVVQAQHIVFQHNHPVFDGKPVAEWDMTYKRQNAAERYAEGLEIFNRRNPKK